MTARFFQLATALLLLMLALDLGYDYLRPLLYDTPAPRAVTARGGLAGIEETAIEVFERTAPSVVFVATFGQPGADRVPVVPHGSAELSMGSGFVWDEAGHIVTNHHVIAGAREVMVRFGQDTLEHAEIVGIAPHYELAVLRVPRDTRRYRPLPLGSSEGLRVGQAVFAIGNPFGLSRTLTQGLISAVERRLPTASGREIRGVIQTDASINPGNSGGPLLDSAGRVIGVNTAILSPTGNFAGIGFAVPVDVVNQVVSTLIRYGRLPRPGIGINALDEQLAAHLGTDGIVVRGVVPGSPAEQAGIAGIDAAVGLMGDIITHAEGRPVGTVQELTALLEEVGIGGTVKLRLKRDGRTRNVQVAVADLSRYDD